MKTILPLLGLSIAAALTAALTVLSSGRLPGELQAFTVFIGGYAAGGVLAVLVADYARRAPLRRRRSRKAPPAETLEAGGATPAAATWTQHTLTT